MRQEIKGRNFRDSERKHEAKPFSPISHFLIQFGINHFDSEGSELFVQDNKYYLISKQMQGILSNTKKPFCAGAYLGKARGKKFFPSVNFLRMFARSSRNKVWIDDKTSWLFVCGRDIFSGGIVSHTPSVYKGIITVVLSQSNEVLGFGKAMKHLTEKGAVIENIFDIGDFLRREKRRR